MQPVPSFQFLSIPWVLVGGLATRAYMPERVTLDVDILIHETDERTARQEFENAGYQIEGDLSIGGFTAQRGNEAPVDILASRAAWVPQALGQPGQDAAGLPVLGRPYLMVMKLVAGRLQDLTDVQRMLRDTPQDERTSTRKLIQQCARDMAEDFDQLVLIADAEFG